MNILQNYSLINKLLKNDKRTFHRYLFDSIKSLKYTHTLATEIRLTRKIFITFDWINRFRKFFTKLTKNKCNF